METKLSTKGQVVLPDPIRRRLGLRAGDVMDVSIEAGRIVLRPHRKRARRAKIVNDPVTGLPVLDPGPDAPELTSKEVNDMLANFP